MVQGRGDDALGPEAARAQLVHADARVDGVVAGADPVVGGRGHDETHPARAAGRAARQQPAEVRHARAAVRNYALQKKKKTQLFSRDFSVM